MPSKADLFQKLWRSEFERDCLASETIGETVGETVS